MDILLLYGLGPFLALVVTGALVMAFAMTCFAIHDWAIGRLDDRQRLREIDFLPDTGEETVDGARMER